MAPNGRPGLGNPIFYLLPPPRVRPITSTHLAINVRAEAATRPPPGDLKSEPHSCPNCSKLRSPSRGRHETAPEISGLTALAPESFKFELRAEAATRCELCRNQIAQI